MNATRIQRIGRPHRFLDHYSWYSIIEPSSPWSASSKAHKSLRIKNRPRSCTNHVLSANHSDHGLSAPYNLMTHFPTSVICKSYSIKRHTNLKKHGGGLKVISRCESLSHSCVTSLHQVPCIYLSNIHRHKSRQRHRFIFPLSYLTTTEVVLPSHYQCQLKASVHNHICSQAFFEIGHPYTAVPVSVVPFSR